MDHLPPDKPGRKDRAKETEAERIIMYTRISPKVTILPAAAICFLLTGGCSLLGIDLSERGSKSRPDEQISAKDIRPDLDFSGEIPDCITAGERLAEYIQVGMTLGDVKRLVGRPFYESPGSWRWSNNFVKDGLPKVSYRLGVAHDGAKVSSLQVETFNCDTSELSSEEK